MVAPSSSSCRERDAIMSLCCACVCSDAGLAMYIGFASAVELEDEPWWAEGFPEELQLRHALEVYRWLAREHGAAAM
jgi:hypothetical protein